MNKSMDLDNLHKINVLIVDDHPIMREGLRKLLQEEPDIMVVAEAGTGQQACDIAGGLEPEGVLLGINLPNFNGSQVASKLEAERNGIAAVLLTGYDDEEQVLQAKR